MLASSPHHHTTMEKSPQHHNTHTLTPHPHFSQPQIHNDLQTLQHNLSSALTHLFAPVSCQQCISTSPYRLDQCTSHIMVDDEFVLVDEVVGEEEVDGGPLCREATIESWKVSGKGRGSEEVMLKDRKRRLSVHCFGS
jgi:hypothetical protein